MILTSLFPVFLNTALLAAERLGKFSYKFMKARYKHEHMERNC